MLDRTHARRLLAGVLSAAVVLAAAVAGATPAAADHDVTPARFDGATRFETAANIARFDHPEGSGVALLANGMGFADALAAGPMSRSTVAPLLLAQHDRIPPATDQAFTDLGVQEVFILGGTAAISAQVESELQQRFDRVERFDGATRFQTAIRIAESINASPNAEIGEIGGQRTAMIVNAFTPADAVLAGAFGAGQENPFPILFTEQGILTNTTEQALRDLGIQHTIIVGGPLAVGDQVEQRLSEMGLDPTRLGGQTRMDTATLVADHAQLVLGWDSDLVNLARGDEFADALAAGPYAGRAGAPILLTENPTELGARTEQWLSTECAAVGTIRAIGGEAAVATATLEAAETAAENCHDDTQTQQTYMVAPMEAVEYDVGTRAPAEVIGRYDDATFTGPVNVAIFPCRYTDVTGSDPDTFQEATGDGNADFLGKSDAGSTAIIDVNGDPVGPAGQVTGVAPTDGTIEIGLRAEAADCVVVAVYADENDNRELDVGTDGQPTEPYGVTEISWA